VKKNKAKTEILTTKKNVDFQEMILIKIGGHLMEEKVQIVNGGGGGGVPIFIQKWEMKKDLLLVIFNLKVFNSSCNILIQLFGQNISLK
jgi:hypothetical protein